MVGCERWGCERGSRAMSAADSVLNEIEEGKNSDWKNYDTN